MKWFGVVVSAILMCFGSGTFAMAEGAVQNPVGPIDGPGQGVAGLQTQQESQALTQEQGNLEFYLKEVNKRIVEMKMESCPIDQILRAQDRVNHSKSITVKYYAIGQRPIASTLTEATTAGTGDMVTLKVANKAAFDHMDIIMFPEVMGWEQDGTTRSTLVPLQVRVMSSDDNNYPKVYAVNGSKVSDGTRFGMPVIPEGAKMLRLGRAAAELDVETGSYYVLPEASEKYCQRFIMQCEQSIIERMSAKEIPWTFSRQERIAMDDMRGGIERQGLFGYNNKMIVPKDGVIYTTGGIYWDAGKDLELGHWIQKKDENGTPITVKDASDGETVKNVYEYVISEKELTAFIAAAIKDAGNASRTKMLFVDNLIYQAFTNLRSTRRVITETEKNYQGWGLDFESFTSMGTKILIYRHDGFNYYGMDGHAFMLDARYLEKWVFGDWSRKEYDLKNLFVRNSNAVVMEEFSCWTLSYPQAHARVTRPEFDSTLGVTDEVIAA